jgi:hypothetical protein
MEEEIRTLFIKYGIVEVKECVEKECRRLYESLQSIYEVKRKYERKGKVEEPLESPVAVDVNPVAERKHIRKVKVIKNVEETSQAKAKESKEDNNVKELPNILQIIKKSNKIFENAPVEVESETESEQNHENKEKEVVDEREVHRMIVAERNKELLEQGIEPESLLTKENLEKWLNSGKSYMRIAKETGIDAGEVSRKSKEFGLSSKTSKYKFYKRPKILQK